MDRAQAHTLEAFTAALLLVTGAIFALQATAVTPLSTSTSNQYVENQERTMAEDLLAISAEDGTLKFALLDWNTSTNLWADVGDPGFFTGGGPPNEFGQRLDDAFLADRIAFNVYVIHRTADGSVVQDRLVFMGAPSDNAIVASQLVVVFDDDELTGPSDETVASAATDGNFYAEDAFTGSMANSTVFNVMEVRIVAWEM